MYRCTRFTSSWRPTLIVFWWKMAASKRRNRNRNHNRKPQRKIFLLEERQQQPNKMESTHPRGHLMNVRRLHSLRIVSRSRDLGREIASAPCQPTIPALAGVTMPSRGLPCRILLPMVDPRNTPIVATRRTLQHPILPTRRQRLQQQRRRRRLQVTLQLPASLIPHVTLSLPERN